MCIELIMHWILLQLLIFMTPGPVLNVKVASSQELNSTLHLNEYGVPFAYVGEVITFTCRTERSNSIGWSSEEYIGVNRLNFASVESDGTTRPPTESGAVAQLIRSYRVDGIVVLISQLQIIVQSLYQVASVTCHNIGIDTINTSSFRMADNTSITCDTPAICPGEKVSCACTTAHSNTLAWSSDQLIGNGGAELVFSLNEPLLARQNVSSMVTSAVLSGTSEENGVLVLKSELSFELPSTSFDIVLTCENVDHQNSYSIILPIYTSIKCATPTTIRADPTTTTEESINTTTIERPYIEFDSSGLSEGVITGIVTILIGTCLLLLLIIIYVTIFCWKIQRKFNGITLSNSTTRKESKKRRIQSDSTTGGDLRKQPPDSDSVGNSTSVHDQELEDEAYGSDQSTPKLDQSVTMEPDLETIIESETEAVPSIIYSTTRGTDWMPVYSSFVSEFKPSSSFITDKLKQEILTLEKLLSKLKRQMQQLAQEVKEKDQQLKRKKNELEQQQKAGLRAQIQNREIDYDDIEMCPVQESEPNKDTSSVEANMAGKGDRLHVAPAGNLKRPSVPHSGFRCLTTVY